MSALAIGIPIVVKLVEKFMGRGKGADKKSVALELLKRLMETIDIPGVGLPGETELGSLIEQAVRELNEKKLLVGTDTVVAENAIDAQLVAIGSQMMQNGLLLVQKGGVR